jgi:hypothetical protein
MSSARMQYANATDQIVGCADAKALEVGGLTAG